MKDNNNKKEKKDDRWSESVFWSDIGIVGHNHSPQFHYYTGDGRDGHDNFKNMEIAMKKSEENKSMTPIEMILKYAQDNNEIKKILVDVYMKYGAINLWCFVYDLDKKGITGKAIEDKYNENGRNLSKFVKSIWSGAQAVIEDIDSGKCRPS